MKKLRTPFLRSVLAALFILPLPYEARAQVAISNLPVATAVVPTDVVPLVQGTGPFVTRKVTVQELVQQMMPGRDISGALVTATDSTTPRTLAARHAEMIYAVDYGAVCDGASDSKAGINAAITAANARPSGATVMLPAGICRINLADGGRVVPKSNVTLAGQGMGRSVILVDDTAGGNDGISNGNGGWTFAALDNFHMRDLTVRGYGATVLTLGGQVIRLKGSNITIERVSSEYSRNFGMVIFGGDNVVVRDSRVYRSRRDGIAVWSVPNAMVTGNQVIDANDDSISLHSADTDAAPVRSGLVVTNNTVIQGQGIKVLGAKLAMISGNIVMRSKSYGMYVAAHAVDDVQGQTPQFGVQIKNNIIADVWIRGEPSPLNLIQFYMRVVGGVRRAGSGASPPGSPVSGTGVVTSLLGSNGPGTLYGNETFSGTTPSPGGYWIDVTGNQLIRTLPAVTTFSQWGYGSLWIGEGQSGTAGLWNGAVTESMLNTGGLRLEGALRNSRVADNVIQTTGPYAISFRDGSAVAPNSMDLDGLEIVGNRLIDFQQRGIHGPAGSTYQRVTVERNIIDGDPYFKSANRGSNGAWASGADLQPVIGIDNADVSGFQLIGNVFRNVVLPLRGPDTAHQLWDNVVVGDPAATGFSTSNKGVGTVPRASPAWRHIIEDSDPASANYGSLLSPTRLVNDAMPASGKYVEGAFVRASLPVLSGGRLLWGWSRITTGSGHVSGTDWVPLYISDGTTLATPKTTIYTSGTNTWTKDTRASVVEVELWAPGGYGGNGGLCGSGVACSGGGGGGGGERQFARFRASDLPSSLSTVCGGSGSVGVRGSATIFGASQAASIYMPVAVPGGVGSNGGTAVSAGGGSGGGTGINPGGDASGTTGGVPGAPGGGTGGSGATTTYLPAGPAAGAGGPLGAAGINNGGSGKGGQGGQSGGGISSGNVAFAGGPTYGPGVTVSGGTAGSGGNGGNGNAPPAFTYGRPFSISAGGGGAAVGGNGGTPPAGQIGAGGSGGGAAQTGFTAGGGGAPGGCLVRITEY